MNRRILGVSAGLVLLSGCGEPVPAEVIPTPPTIETLDQAPLLDKPLLEIGGVTVICAGIEGLNRPYTDAGCAEAAKNVSEGFRRIAEATEGAIPVPAITTINIKDVVAVDSTKDRCSQNEFIASGFAYRVLQATLAAPSAQDALRQQPPGNVLHVVSESPATKACHDTKRPLQARYMRGQPQHPVVQFTGEGKNTDANTAAREHLHRRIGDIVRLTYTNNAYYAGEDLDGTEAFKESIPPAPPLMDDHAEPYINAFQQLQLGIIEPGNIAMPTASGEIILESPQSKNEGQRLLTLPLNHPKLLSRSSFLGVGRPRYWLEHTGGNEISILVVGESAEGRQPEKPALMAQLHAGQPRFTDKSSRFSLELEQINEAQAKLKLTVLK